MNQEKLNQKYIRRCFTLAKKGYGKVNPNPYVGCVIVKNGKIIAEGWHHYFGGPHAEPNAISKAKQSLKGATLYCNLEPCCHTDKKTPPCTPLVISSGITKVVISTLDPNPKVAGKGVKQLRAAGIEVVTGVLEEEGNELNKFFFHSVKTGLPYVTVKIAQTLDGKINFETKNQTWITGAESKKYVHKLRSIYDAVLVGANTVKVDDPQLNVRLVKGRNPKKIIIDGRLSVPLTRKLFLNDDLADTYIFTSKNVSANKIKTLEKKSAKIYRLALNKNGQLSLKRILKILGKENINSVLVEGGNSTFTQFIENELFNEIIYLSAPKIFGTGLDAYDLKKRIVLDLYSAEKLGEDLKLIYKRK
ncbi:MAG: bifunctional diaminohydroxyphosphoribosylaminopyrimidine deaminase/5-amino-6-(5-phosphoribosylamino)uracil reductase RibD [Ignavibacteriae bacterium]|nr:bifunctional diaminohydroxyphosphoribosylaminopyrimidine deaminase/5-amino-6-(5-phosphoribosylamino)uracil reductase RibD [Ignavibacteriota bacterium]NOG97042.1 bifunctional diaminohydroxyphosphoribosylaminopyrimidine deaminase/5-amino-6-(5-phosphoribosylamino)uracil reductase RibD [Ignavibacteriota bacterium]